MEQSLHFERGWLVWREAEERIELELSCRDDKLGLYKAWIAGNGAPFLLGTLLPEGGMLRLRRKLTQRTLEAQRCWPIRRAGAMMAYRFHPEDEPVWRICSPSDTPVLSGRFRSPLGEMQDCLLRESDAGLQLAVPFAPKRPFPLTALFCLCEVQSIYGELFAVYTFDEAGLPKVPAS